jgi:hypothetical protein
MRKHLRPFFHWTYSQFFIGGLFAAGVAMLTYNHFLPAYIFFSVAAIWALIYWQVSDHLNAKAVELEKRSERFRRKPKQEKTLVAFKKARRSYWTSNLAGSAMMVVLFISCLIWTHSAQVENALSLMAGPLLPANDPNPPNDVCAPNDDEIAVFMGQKAFKTAQFPQTVIRIGDDPVISIDRTSSGAISLSLDVRGNDGRIIARIHNNVFEINQNNYLSMKRKDRSSLAVDDQYGNEVLNARFLNPRAFRLTAKLYSAGKSLDTDSFPGLIGGFCFSVAKGAKVGSIVQIN